MGSVPTLGVFLETPETLGRISGDIKRFVPSKGKRFNSWNFAIASFSLVSKTCSKITFSEAAVYSLKNGFLGPKSFWNFWETDIWSEFIAFLVSVHSQFWGEGTGELHRNRIHKKNNNKWTYLCRWPFQVWKTAINAQDPHTLRLISESLCHVWIGGFKLLCLDFRKIPQNQRQQMFKFNRPLPHCQILPVRYVQKSRLNKICFLF